METLYYCTAATLDLSEQTDEETDECNSEPADL